MALHVIGTKAANSLVCLPAWAASLAAADVGAIAAAITGDGNFAAILGQPGTGAKAVLATGSTHTSTTLDTLVTSAGAPLAQIHVGDLVLGIGIPPGTFVASVTSGTAVVLSQAATATAGGVYIAFVRQAPRAGIELSSAELFVPRRGTLKVLPGDVVAIDNTGFPYLIPAAAISYLGSQWTFS
jgi:hypothetical protein